MRTLLVIVAVLVLGVVGVGLLLPADYTVARDRTVGAPPSRVFDALRDLRTWREWSFWSIAADPDCTWTYAGADDGSVPSSVRWSGPINGDRSIEVLDRTRPSRLRLAFTFEDGDTELQSYLDVELVADAAGTFVTFTLSGTMSSDPAHRWVGLFMDATLGDALEESLDGLEEYVTRRAVGGD